MVSQVAEQEKNRFIIGTQDPRDDNEVNIIYTKINSNLKFNSFKINK